MTSRRPGESAAMAYFHRQTDGYFTPGKMFKLEDTLGASAMGRSQQLASSNKVRVPRGLSNLINTADGTFAQFYEDDSQIRVDGIPGQVDTHDRTAGKLAISVIDGKSNEILNLTVTVTDYSKPEGIKVTLVDSGFQYNMDGLTPAELLGLEQIVDDLTPDQRSQSTSAHRAA